MTTSTSINIKNLIKELKLISPDNVEIIYEIINHILNNDYIDFDLSYTLKIIYDNLDKKIPIFLKNEQYDLISKLMSIRQTVDILKTQLNIIYNLNTNKNITENINSISEITNTSNHSYIEPLDNNIDICSINNMPLNNTIIAQIIAYNLSNDIDFTKKNTQGFIFQNELYRNITTWKNILIETCKLLFQKDPNLFNSLPYNEDLQGKQHTTYFSTSRTKATINNRRSIRRPYKIPTSNVYVETNLSANNIVSLIKKLLLLYNVPLSNYKILILENTSNLSKKVVDDENKAIPQNDSLTINTSTNEKPKADIVNTINRTTEENIIKQPIKKIYINDNIQNCPSCNHELENFNLPFVIIKKCPFCKKHYISHKNFSQINKSAKYFTDYRFVDLSKTNVIYKTEFIQSIKKCLNPHEYIITIGNIDNISINMSPIKLYLYKNEFFTKGWFDFFTVLLKTLYSINPDNFQDIIYTTPSRLSLNNTQLSQPCELPFKINNCTIFIDTVVTLNSENLREFIQQILSVYLISDDNFIIVAK